MIWQRPSLLKWLLPAAVLLVYVAAGIWTILANGSTNDEYAAHILGGYLYWSSGKFAGGVSNPPLGQLWVALPLWLFNQPLTPFSDAAPLLPRLANLMLSVGLLLWIYLYSQRRLGGAAALVALLAVAFCPEFLAHSTLATLELPTTFALWGATVTFVALLLRPRWGSLLLCAFFVSVALLVKVTGLLLFPIFAGLTGVLACTPAGRRYARRLLASMWRQPGKWGSALVLFGFVIWFLLAAAYRFEGVGEAKPVSSLFAPVAWLLPSGYVNATLGKLAYAGAGNLTYLFGRFSTGGWWWYYPVVLLVKTPFALVALWGVALVWNVRRWTVRSLLRVAPALLFLALALAGNRAQIGVRHLLPMVPFLAVGAGALLRSRARAVQVAAGVLTAGAVLGGILSLPYPLTAESLLVRGKGYRYFADANYDWGQANGAIRQRLAADSTLLRPAAYTPAAGRFVLRVNELNGFGLSSTDEFHWLRGFEPSGRIAGAGLLFEISGEQLERRYSSAGLKRIEAFEAGMYWGGRGQWEKASRYFSAAQESYSSPGRILYAKARLLEKQNALPVAHKELRRAHLLEPDNPEIANAYERLELLLLAEHSERRAPAQAALQRANAALLAGEYDAAAAYGKAARDKGAPGGLVDQLAYRTAVLSGRWEEARSILRRMGQAPTGQQPLSASLLEGWLTGEASGEELRELAGWSYLRRVWGQAARVLGKLLGRDPGDSGAAALVGQMVVLYKDWSVSMSERERAQLETVTFTGAKVRKK